METALSQTFAFLCGKNRRFRRPTEMLTNRPGHQAAFTLVEIMIVVAVMALLVAVALPSFLRARQRSQAIRILNDLRMIDAAIEQYAIETGKKSGDPVAVPDWTNYIKKDTSLYATGEDLLGNDYGPQTVDEIPFVPIETYYELGRVADDDFWDPYNP